MRITEKLPELSCVEDDLEFRIYHTDDNMLGFSMYHEHIEHGYNLHMKKENNRQIINFLEEQEARL